jgi:hypothetical protein
MTSDYVCHQDPVYLPKNNVITSPIYRTRSIARPPCNGLVAGISRDGGHVLF